MSGDGKKVTVTIDGQEVQVPAGTLLIRAAEDIGIYIPRFCDHPLLDPLGACRQCLVDVEGQRKPLTACTTTATDGMVVRTQWSSDMAADAQKGVLELLLINHPLDCPMCDKGGECPLQDQAMAYGPGGSRYIDPKRRFVKPVAISPLVRLDRERCVLCARCTRFADQIADDTFIELFERGALEQVAIFEDEPYESIFSGNVIQICPVGALTSQTFRFRARPFDMVTTESVCNRCASGCTTSVQTRRGTIQRILARENPDVNEEWLCDKGRFAYPYVHDRERVTEPLVRKENEFVATSWTEALTLVAERVTAARASGRGAAILAGANMPDEDAYAVARFARTVLGTNDVDARRRAGTQEEDELLEVLARTQSATYQDIDRAKAVLIVGTDVHEESPIVFLRLRKAARKSRAKLVEISPRRTRLAGSGAGWLPSAPGAEGAALLALASALEGLGNSGLDPWTRAAAAGPSASSVIEAAGVDTEGVRELAQMLADARGNVVVLLGESLAQSPGALALGWNIAAALEGSAGWLPRKAGARGAVGAGLHPALLPGGRRVADPEARAAVEEVWGVAPPEAPGRDTRAILESAADLDVLFLVGADPVTDAGVEGAAASIEAAPFVVAIDMFLTESSRRADVILPVASAYEREGSLTNWEGRAQLTGEALRPPGVAQPDFEILAGIALTLGHRFPSTLQALRKEIVRLAVEPEPPRPIPIPEIAPPPMLDGTLALVPAPRLIDDGVMMRGATELRETALAATVAVSPEDARALGLAGGDVVRVSGALASIEAQVVVDEGVVLGAVVVPVNVDGVDAVRLAAEGSVRVRLQKVEA